MSEFNDILADPRERPSSFLIVTPPAVRKGGKSFRVNFESHEESAYSYEDG